MLDGLSMITLGIDLSAQPEKTACCRIAWDAEGARVMSLGLNWTDDRIIELSTDVDALGIDAPFGFPALINRALPEYARNGRFPQRPQGEPDDAWSQRLRFRETDRAVHRRIAETRGLKMWPLSVSSDRIAVCAWRCASLLTVLFELHGDPMDRIGGSPRERRPLVAEVYPAAALAVWQLPFKGYKPGSAGSDKSARAREVRESIVMSIMERFNGRFTVEPEQREQLVGNDDLLDAFISALVTRAVALDQTLQPDPEQREAAAEEGWIHLPRAPLADLLTS